MNAHKALKRARKLFGPDGFVIFGRHTKDELDEHGEVKKVLQPPAYLVGLKRDDKLHLAGVGKSWEEAFADAEAKKTRYQHVEATHG